MRVLALLIIGTIALGCKAPQNDTDAEGHLLVHINKNIENAGEDYFDPVLQLWLAALDTSRLSALGRAELWHRADSRHPEIAYYTLRRDVALALSSVKDIQCTVMGLIPAEHNHYLLKTMMTSHSTDGDTVRLALCHRWFNMWSDQGAVWYG